MRDCRICLSMAILVFTGCHVHPLETYPPPPLGTYVHNALELQEEAANTPYEGEPSSIRGTEASLITSQIENKAYSSSRSSLGSSSGINSRGR